MWPFRKKEIKYYRICRIHGKYRIQRKLPSDYTWVQLFHYPTINKYEWYPFGLYKKRDYVFEANSLNLAREKLSELVPQFFDAEEPEF